MNRDVSGTNERDSELRDPLRTVVRELKATPVSRAAVERVTQRASSLRNAGPRPRKPMLRKALTWGIAAASLLLAIAFWLDFSSRSFAAVMRNVKAKPWVRMRFEDAAGVENVIWFALARDVCASQRGENKYFDDHRLEVRYAYEPDSKKEEPTAIHRAPLPEFIREEFRSFESLLLGVPPGRTGDGSPIARATLVEQSQRQIEADGRHWLEYDLTVRHQRTEQLIRLLIDVDPKTRLPDRMKITVLSDPPMTIAARFDYPAEEEGPVDIYSLGAPRTAKIVDHLPNDDLKAIVAGVEDSIERFGDYQAYVVHVSRPATRTPWNARQLITYSRKGNRWRAGVATIDPKRRTTKVTTPPADPRKWWNERLKDSANRPSAICDGRAIYYNESQEDGDAPRWKKRYNIDPNRAFISNIGMATQGRPDFYAYGQTPLPSLNQQVTLTANPETGPPGSVLLATKRIGRVWLDPARSHVALRYESKVEGRTFRYLMDRFDRTPSGVWYPTFVRWQRADAEAEGGFVDNFGYRIFVNFDVDLPDELFEP